MVVILDNIRSALNVGSILRTCDALNIKEIYLCGITPGIENNKVLKTSLGAEKNIKTKYFGNTLDALGEVKKKGYAVVGLEIDPKAIPITEVKTEKEIALIVGNEISGIAEEVKNESEMLAKIPMLGIKESLNVSVAFGIAAFQLLTNRK